ncbi:MAG: hypothetical protein A2275_15260 [Bacteroidetes bacterium RIFOXYA12_FULL_35_11]|nr:MAG: hypothetical protein A2X01_08080 [Bacteroidetes bacterium GWF2_35_48]OFY83295.1 MAG: hypothetical protein A2275_15260 [Bacteroidetes bacterium RIFOXYA12_FULL_35_11]OFY93098.1 MAG: hypothetical protein A2491_03505 [Bacteroidetes bacterium RIFOXYC12_FULL_35_7]HBX52651.1 hypothetical protein [Bacteroidales bacterium]
MRVQTKILLLIILVFLIFIIFLLGFLYLRNEQNNAIAEERKERQKTNIKTVINLHTKSMAETVSDYAVWDEMVRFVNKPDDLWAQDNLLYTLKFYHIDAIWVYNEKYELVYHVNQIVGFRNKTVPVPIEALKKIQKQRTFIYHSSLHPSNIQICGSSIHPIKDINRLTEPKGFLLMGKLWNNTYIDELSKLTGTRIFFKDTRKNKLSHLKTDFVNIYPLHDYKGNKITDVVFIKDNPFLSILQKESFTFIIFFLILAVIMLSLFVLTFHKMVSIPLGKISKSLTKSDISLLTLKNKKDEFGQISGLIKKFYEQKEILEEQIQENILKTKLIEESARTFKNFIEQSSDGILIFDQSGLLIQYNSAILKYLEKDSNSIAEIKMWDLHNKMIHEKLNTKIMDQNYLEKIQNALKNKEADFFNFRNEIYIEIPPDKRLFATQTIFPIVTEDQFLVGMIIRDITKLKEAENEIIRALSKEKELHELKTQFVSTVSHEFRTPMTIIYSNLQLMESIKDKMSPEEISKSYSRVYTAIKQMTQILDQVNLVNKDMAGKLIYKPYAVNLETFVKQLVDELSSLSQKVKIELVFKEEFGVIYFDPTLTQYIIMNLLSNAIKFSLQSDTVLFIISKINQSIHIEITDHGIGIPKEDQHRLFEAFFRARNAANIKGTGLGLSIVKRSVDIHNGAINFESEEGAGTKVTVILPFGEKSVDEKII